MCTLGAKNTIILNMAVYWIETKKKGRKRARRGGFRWYTIWESESDSESEPEPGSA
jgi:hypothetical protein